MSKILFLADLHGNMPATLALEREIKKIAPDDVYFVGDCVGKGPENDKTLEWVRANCKHFVAGNWDDGIVKGSKNCLPGYEASHFFWDQLSKEQLAWLESLPFEDEVLISGLNFRIFHGRPTDQNYHSWLNPAELEPAFTNKAGKKFDGFICADCHQAYIRETGNGFAINTGSVGNALGVPRCHALLIEGDVGSTERTPIRFTTIDIPYDNQLAAEIARNCSELPNKEAYIKEVLTGVYSR